METIAIEKALKRHERILSRIETKLDTAEIAGTVNEEQAADFLGWEVSTLRNNISNGTIPAAAIVEMVNGKRRFRLEKLVKK